MNKTAFTIFHSPNPERDELYHAARNTMLLSFDELKTETVFFKDDSELFDFYKNSELVFNKNGIFDKGWTIGQLGLWASTYVAIKDFLKSDYENLIILEDDIILMNNFIDNLLFYMTELSENWAMFFGYVPDHFKLRFKKILRTERKKVNIQKPNIIKAFQEECTVCYVVSRSGAERFLELLKTPFSSPIDYWLFRESGLPIYTIKPNIPDICRMATTKSQVDARVISKKFYNMETLTVEDQNQL